MHARHDWFPSAAMGRNMHMWTYGYAGRPVLGIPTAGGYAHEWQMHGAVEALQDVLDAGLVRLYVPETNVAETWTNYDRSPRIRVRRHAAYEQFVTEELVPRIHHETGRRDILTLGASVGAMYAVNFALKYPHLFPQVVGLSGRYEARFFLNGHDDEDVYYSNPLAYAWNLNGEHIERIRRLTHVTLVCGQGNFEGNCLAETRKLALAFKESGVPYWADIWGTDVAHDWHWWRRQLRFHIVSRLNNVRARAA